MKTLWEWLKYGEGQLLLGPHPEKARLDAEVLLLGALAKSRVWLITHPDMPLSAENSACYLGSLADRFAGKPIQYIQKHCEFYGLPLRVTPDVLIPRPETEHLVEQAISRMRATHQPRIVDVGTGSGAIAIALARHLPGARVVAVDISPAALELAEINAEHNELRERIHFKQSDLLSFVVDEQFDIVVSNPPYVSELDRELLPVEVRDYEPGLALFAGNDGLAIYRRLIPEAFAVLTRGGFIALEIGYAQADAVSVMLSEAGFANVEITDDLQSIPRVIVARRP